MQISLESIIDQTPLGAYRIGIVIICLLIVMMDGFDTQAIGFAAAAISSARSIPVADLGRLFSSGLLGSATGAFVLGPLGDRLGRRRMLILSVLLFSIFSFSLPHLTSFPQLMACRALTGLGLGGALPNLLALCAEYTPRPMRGVVTGVLFAGFPCGGVAGALVSAHIAPTFGWQSIFYIGGLAPLLLAVFVMLYVPHSLQSLLLRRDGQRRVAAIAARIKPASQPDAPVEYVDTSEQQLRVSLLQVLRAGGPLPTFLLWCSSFMCFTVLIVVGLWTAVLLRQQGVGEAAAAMIVGAFNFGSVIGTGLGGRLLDRYRADVVLPLTFLAGAICVSLLGKTGGSEYALMTLAILSGGFVGSCSAQLLGLAVLIYPRAIRASGIGWVVATGRDFYIHRVPRRSCGRVGTAALPLANRRRQRGMAR